VHHPVVVVTDPRYDLDTSGGRDGERALEERPPQAGPLEVISHGDRDLQAPWPLGEWNQPTVGDDPLALAVTGDGHQREPITKVDGCPAGCGLR